MEEDLVALERTEKEIFLSYLYGNGYKLQCQLLKDYFDQLYLNQTEKSERAQTSVKAESLLTCE